jgi:hypothetical protein
LVPILFTPHTRGVLTEFHPSRKLNSYQLEGKSRIVRLFLNGLVGGDSAVPDVDAAVSVLGDVVFVRN